MEITRRAFVKGTAGLGIASLFACSAEENNEPSLLTASFSFSPASPGIGQSVQFTDTSTGSPTSWLWDFGDGATSTAQNPSHTYTTQGAKTVTLTATNGTSSDTSTRTVTVGTTAMSRVVAVHNNQVTNWDGSSLWFGSNTYVSQEAVDNMVKTGVMSLTGQSSELDAWTSLLPTVSGTTKIGIKVNANNSEAGPINNSIDWTPQVVNAVIKGLKNRGFSEPNIYVMDPSRGRTTDYCGLVFALYPNVKMCGPNWQHAPFLGITYSSSDSSLTVPHPCGAPSSKYPDQFLDLSYLIQMPIMKVHGDAVTLTYKNLLGYKEDGTQSALHNYLMLANNNPLVNLYANTHIKDKTRLIIGDGIYGHCLVNYGGVPSPPWSVLGNAWPKRLFFATDPVAIDCVMYDFLNWQNPRFPVGDNYIVCAANANQGTRDHWNNPTEKKYSTIDFIQQDVD
jgi:PKD repeat protein